jgi:hypothetical protein
VRSTIRIESIYQTGQVGKWAGMHDIGCVTSACEHFVRPGYLHTACLVNLNTPYTIQVSVYGGKVNGQTAQSEGAISMI